MYGHFLCVESRWTAEIKKILKKAGGLQSTCCDKLKGSLTKPSACLAQQVSAVGGFHMNETDPTCLFCTKIL